METAYNQAEAALQAKARIQENEKLEFQKSKKIIAKTISDLVGEAATLKGLAEHEYAERNQVAQKA